MIFEATNIIERRFSVHVISTDDSDEKDQFIKLLKPAFTDISLFDSIEFIGVSKETIVDYLFHTHSYYLDKMIPEIERTFMEVVRLEQSSSLLILKLLEEFITIHTSLKKHIDEEEQMFGEILEGKHFSNDHHDCNHLERLGHIISILKNLTIDTRSLSINTMLIQKLELFCKDLIVHERIEDELL